MPLKLAIRYLNPWRMRRERAAATRADLRQRDGDGCARCRRPMRFDLPDGHDLAPMIQPRASGPGRALADLCLCHARCNRLLADATPEARERARAAEVERRAAQLAASTAR